METTTTRQLAEATANRDAARRAFHAATTSKARRDADEDLQFWMGKVVALAHSDAADLIADIQFANPRGR